MKEKLKMKILFLSIFAAYLAIDLTAAFVKWFNTKSKKAYWHGFVDVTLTAAVLFCFIKFLEVC